MDPENSLIVYFLSGVCHAIIQKKEVYIMPQKETTNIIIQLKEKGWTGDEIVAFLGFIETHNTSEEELKRAHLTRG